MTEQQLPQLPVVAYGYENTRPTERAALMMVKLGNAGDQYPELATPLVRKADAEAYAIAAVAAERERTREVRMLTKDELLQVCAAWSDDSSLLDLFVQVFCAKNGLTIKDPSNV